MRGILTGVGTFAITFGTIRLLVYYLLDRPMQREINKLKEHMHEQNDKILLLEAWEKLSDEEKRERCEMPFGRTQR